MCDEIEFCAKYNCTGGMPFYEECEATTSTSRRLRLRGEWTIFFFPVVLEKKNHN